MVTPSCERDLTAAQPVDFAAWRTLECDEGSCARDGSRGHGEKGEVRHGAPENTSVTGVEDLKEEQQSEFRDRPRPR